MPASRPSSASARQRPASAPHGVHGARGDRFTAPSAAADAKPGQRTGGRPPRHLITETRDWARILLAAGTAIAAVVTAIGQVIGRLT